MSLDWSELRTLVDNGRNHDIAERLRELDERRRGDLGAALVGYVNRMQPLSRWPNMVTGAVAVAAVGCLPAAPQAANLLTRSQLRWHWARLESAPVITAARDRPIDWLGEFALRLVPKLDKTQPGRGWAFVCDLLMAEHAAIPTDELFVRGWADCLRWPENPRQDVPLVDRLRDDPLLDRLLPRLFEVDDPAIGGGYDAAEGRWRDEPLLLLALVQLADEGRLDRAALMSRCLAALASGGRSGRLRAFARLHDELAPTAAEIAGSSAGYVRLLADAPAFVAATAQRALRTADEAGALDYPSVIEASRLVLGRAEKTLVRGQLIWLDRLARRRADAGTNASEVADVVATVFDHAAGDIRERAQAMAARYSR
jgi:hypothetical protein